MDVLPSYQEATQRHEYWEFVAPYIATRDLRNCCLVDSRFYRIFAPRLWLDPLVIVRAYGLHPNDELGWYLRFVGRRFQTIRLIKRAMVRSMDFRNFAETASGLFSAEASERAISDSFRRFPQLFPHLTCLLMDGHPELNPEGLMLTTDPGSSEQNSLRLLGLASCRHELSNRLYQSPWLRRLVYLDISGIPGSVKSALQSSLNPQFVPDLRVLRIGKREMDDPTALLLCQTFHRRLWSLSLCDNALTDLSLDRLTAMCFSSESLRSDAHFATEGRLLRSQPWGTKVYGAFEHIEESKHSKSYNHPDRYLVDAPCYSGMLDQYGSSERQKTRSDGLGRPRQDTTDAIKNYFLQDALAGSNGETIPIHFGLQSNQAGLTHVRLDGNKFTSEGIGRLLRSSFGRIEHLECDAVRFTSGLITLPSSVPPSFEIHGLVGLAHLFRPVYSSNIRSLRVHHSLVTNIPKVKVEDLTRTEALILAETVFRERIQQAYPATFTPDLNPRIISIALTGIPAVSTSSLISGITKFLDLAAIQERAIGRAARNSSRRSPRTLRGLRHIRLELELNDADDSGSNTPKIDADFTQPQDHMNEIGFDSIYRSNEKNRAPVSQGNASQQRLLKSLPHNGQAGTRGSSLLGEDRTAFSYSNLEGEKINYQVESSNSLAGDAFVIPVWVGRGTPGPFKAVNAYMENLQQACLRRNVGPATPNHVEAGVPLGSYIFYAAWDAMIFPTDIPYARLKNHKPHRLIDVADAIKAYRSGTKGTPNHWSGKLELVRNVTMV